MEERRWRREDGGEKMEGSRLPKKAEAIKQPGHQKRGRPQLRWEDCVDLKRGVRKAGEDDKCREKAVDREKWKGVATGTVQ